MEQSNQVNHPDHYNQGGIECIDAIIAARGIEAAKEFCVCNAMKYLWRLGHKDDNIQEARKAIWYLRKFISLEREQNKSEATSQRCQNSTNGPDFAPEGTKIDTP